MNMQMPTRLFLAILALLAPIGYLSGRFSAPIVAGTPVGPLTSGFIVLTLGVMVGIPIGLFFGAIHTPGPAKSSPSTPSQPSTHEMETDILNQLRAELQENLALFEARKGSSTVVARLEYVTSFWQAVKASGRLFVMQDANLMSTVALAYYWLDQANHLEKLAYDAKNSGQVADSQLTTARLIAEARLLDGSIESSLQTAINALNSYQ
jgi:hypothetical protein